MSGDLLPAFPPAGKKRYKAIYQKNNHNPFKGTGRVPMCAQEADLDENLSAAEVEALARHWAPEGYGFVSIEAAS